MTEDMLTGTFNFLAEVVAARTFSTDEVVTGTFFVREVVTGTFIFSVAETIFLLVEVSGISAIFFSKRKRKDQKDQFLVYNMSLFLKEENGRLVLRYIIYFAKVLR